MTDRPTQPDGRVHGVIVGLVRPEDDRLLVIRRAQTVASPGKIAFPGGAVEADEDRDAAAVREMREELGIEVDVRGPIWRRVFDDRPLTLWGYAGRWVSGELAPDPSEVSEAMWMSADELRRCSDALSGSVAFAETVMTDDAEHRSGPAEGKRREGHFAVDGR
ncbi:MAG: NUDIX domain-containing protein [Planctomycetota bacterium]